MSATEEAVYFFVESKYKLIFYGLISLIMTEERELYPGSSQSRPIEIESGGSGIYCCVPQCGNATYNAQDQRSGIGFFKFPKDTKLRKSWVRVLSQHRRKGGNDMFSINDKTVICEFHFEITEIRVSLGMGRKTLVHGSIPSLFKFRKR